MADPRLFRLRVSYVKQGRLALLSHLEIARALERMVRRSGLPFAVSQGFSPHMRIAFGSALPVGVGSTCEIFDLYLTDYVVPARALAKLKEKSPIDLAPFAASYCEPAAAAASVTFPLSTYEAVLEEAHNVDGACEIYGVDGACGVDGQPAIVVPETIAVVRKRKEKVLKVRDFLQGDVEFHRDETGRAIMTFTLESKPTGSLRPDLFLRACLRETYGDDETEDGSGSESDGGAGFEADKGIVRVQSLTRIAQR